MRKRGDVVLCSIANTGIIGLLGIVMLRYRLKASNPGSECYPEILLVTCKNVNLLEMMGHAHYG